MSGGQVLQILHVTHGEEEEMVAETMPSHGATHKSRWPSRRLMNTLCLDLLWICMGMSLVINGATWVDFSERLHETYGKLGIALSVRNIGFCLGALSGGVLRDKIRLDDNLILTLTSVTIAIATAIKPWSGNLVVFTIILVVESYIIFCMSAVGNAMLMSMWKEQSASPVQSFHFSFGIGALLAPILAKPFLSVRCPQVFFPDTISQNTSHYITTESSPLGETITPLDTCANKTSRNGSLYLLESHIEIPFTIIAVIFLIIAMFFSFLYCSSDDRKVIRDRVQKAKTDSVDKQIQARQRRFNIIIVFLTACFYFGQGTLESTMASYLFTIAYELGIGFTKTQAADVFSAYFATFTGARFLGMIIFRRFSVHNIFIFIILGVFCALCGLAFGGLSSKLMYWVFSCLTGIVVGPLWPAGYSWANGYVTVSASFVAIFDTGAVAGGVIAAVLCGYFIEEKMYFYVFLYIFVIWGGVCLVVIGLYILTWRRPKRQHGN